MGAGVVFLCRNQIGGQAMRTPLGEMGVNVGADGRLQAVVWETGMAGRGAAEPGAVGRWEGALADYFAKQPPRVDFAALDLVGTPFQRRVWAALVEIPWGETCTYGDLAARLGSSARAVGGAVGANPAPILVPCHRVMGANGAMTGFSAPGGVATKAWLLAHERGE